MNAPNGGRPILLELSQDVWKDQIDNVESWLGNVLMLQASFRKLAEDTAGKIRDPRIKEQIVCIADTAKEHERKVDDLYRLIGREPSKVRATLGTVMAKAQEAMADLGGMAGGAAGAWNDLRRMLLVNLNAIGAFGAVEQLGLALGMPELARAAFDIVRDKSTAQLVMQEFMLEMAPIAILYDSPI